MPSRSWLHHAAVALIIAAGPPALFAQWLGYPTAGVPSTPTASQTSPRPRRAPPTGSRISRECGDGQPSVQPCGARCTDVQIGWEFLNIARNLKGGLPYQPWAAELVKKRKADNAKDDPNVRCMPRGALRIWTDDYYKRIYEVPDRVIILTERNMQYRQIFTDGRPLPADPNPTWNGYSTAKWEGDTLVVHTIGFRDDLWLDSDGNPLTNAGKVTEKIRRPNYGTLEIEITVDDPKAYTAPWTIKMIQPIVLDSELLDYYCLENEKDFAHMVGK